MRSRALLLACLIGAGCEPTTRPVLGVIAGTIVAVDVSISIGAPPTIHVKETEAEECGIIFLVRPSTSIRRQAPGGALITASASELTLGRRVEVRTELVLDSCPGQSSAHSIVILR
jgi:hypothetical protein